MIKVKIVMCILFFDFEPFPETSAYKLILASNRDEFYDRPTAIASFWNDNTNICAGKTIESQGASHLEIPNSRFLIP